MFDKVLIANRGEIAVRIIRTCKKLGIKTVAVYSEADVSAPHVEMAEEAHLIGGARVSESYLNIEKIIEVAKKTNSNAIHPGYGLLSENPKFALRCKEEGIIFIGPSSEVIANMGSKIESRKAMQKAGVSIIPGINHPLKNVEEAIEISSQMGYPVMLKASAGGGGIGMQIVSNNEELKKVFGSNEKRATELFGNGAMYIEKFIESPRHIEIQVLADKVGNVVYLWERECSIQRRHQKVIEEAPSSFLDEATRSKMGQAAILASKSIGYENAGTIEFLVDNEKNFYFLEMNTRLQVEHPVTEEITGIDLVEEQLKIAAGMELSFRQEDIARVGHAIEVRIYAEDPITFFPSPGKVEKLKLPEGKGIRNELGIEEGSSVTPFYDPMIAKLIVHAESREDAITKLSQALDEYEITGIKTNIPMLKNVIAHREFYLGNTKTNFIDEYIKGLIEVK
ncbi:acetyl-CoA carboxylase biotin carboxylase subunit [Sporosarcina sp. CAU 1771]